MAWNKKNCVTFVTFLFLISSVQFISNQKINRFDKKKNRIKVYFLRHHFPGTLSERLRKKCCVFACNFLVSLLASAFVYCLLLLYCDIKRRRSKKKLSRDIPE